MENRRKKMGRRMKSRRRLGAGVLTAAMIFGLAAPYQALSVHAEPADGQPVNLAIGATASANDVETSDYTADKAIDGIVNREAPKPQSRWATNVSSAQAPKILTVDLKEEKTFQSFVIAWERNNITSYKIETSDSGEDGSWTTVYDKAGDNVISAIDENIHLAEPVSAQYVRLYVDGYTPGDSNWQSVSVYEFQIYEDEIPDENLPDENYCLEGTAEVSNYEETSSNPGSQNGAKAIDGDMSTRWATNNDGKGTTARTLTVTLPAAQRVQFFKVFWEKANIKNYTIDVSESDDGEFTTVYTNSEQITNTQQTISLDAPVWAKKIRLNVTAYAEAVSNWWNVSVKEFEAYAVEPGAIKDDSTAEEIVDLLNAPVVNTDEMKVTVPETVPEGTEVEFLADYEQIIGRDGTIYQPLADTTVKVIYKVTKDEESVEGSTEYTLTIPGRYSDAGVNEKPTVIPELAEWYGGTEAGNFEIGSRILVSEDAAEFMDAANALKEDYEAELGASLTVETGDDPKVGDIYFAKDDGNHGLGEEGYIMDIDDYALVAADHSTGAYWATRSILQIAELNGSVMPKGEIKDYPKYEIRGFMLDVARKPVSMETLEDIAREMAYYKMNEFHIHLNDNLIFYEDYASAAEARDKAYTGFRLESDVVEGGNDGLNKADLTNEDLYYTKEEFRDFILECRAMGVSITPEFDTPGHSGAFTKVRPDLMLQSVQSGQANRAGEQFDLTEGKYDESLAFVESIWDEYLNEDMFDSSMTVHIGTDEYYGEKDRFRKFSDDLIKYVESKGYKVRLWGSLTGMPGTTEVKSEGVELNVWNTGWANPTTMYNDGFELINTIDSSLYMVPAAGYYNDYLNTQNLYNNWVPNNFSGTVIPAGSDQMLGSTYAIWNDSVDTRANGIAEIDLFDRFADAVPTMASKNWGEGQDLTYAEMEAVVAELGNAAGSNPYYEASADENGEYMSYEFDDKTDSSANGRDLKDMVNADVKDGSLTLKGGESYAETPIGKLATGNTLEFDITLEKPAQAGDILFEADNVGSNDDYAHTIQIMDDGRLGFRRELYDYYFDYKLPVGEKVHLAISTSGTTTSLTVNGTTYEASGVYRNRQTDGGVRVENISKATLLLPLQRIGSKTNAIEAVIGNVTVKQGVAVDYNKSGWKKVEVDTETVYTATEGLFEYAFDGNSGTIWHSNWQGASDKLKPQGTWDEIGGVIDLGEKYTINQFKFTPRTGSDSGLVTKADLYVKANEGDEWIKVAEDAAFAADRTTKTFYFDEQEVRYIKFVAKASNDGWVAVSEFDIANAPEQTYTVYVDAQEGGKAAGGEKGVAAGAEVTVKAEAEKGYTFAGWYDAVTGAKVSDQAEYTFAVEENTALTAYFTKNDEPVDVYYTVTVDGEDYEVKEGETLSVDEPEKPGHRFDGFYLVGTDTKVDFAQPITKDMDVESRFTAYTVTALTDGNGTASASEMQADGSVTVIATENEGYFFKGWMVDGEVVSNLNVYTFVPTADTEITAIFAEVQSGGTYHVVIIGGHEVTVEDGMTLTQPEDPVKDGYKFIGWYVGDEKYDFSKPVTSDLVIEARFEKIETPTPEDPDDKDPDDQKPGDQKPNDQKPNDQKPSGGNDGGKNDGSAVKTGDSTGLVPWAAAMILAAGAAAAALGAGKRKNKR